jgi:SAM-dependent methyltransferase
MHVENYSFMLDTAAKFFRTTYLSGWFHHPDDQLAGVTLDAEGLLASTSEVGLAHGGGPQELRSGGWRVQAMLSADHFPREAIVRFNTLRGRVIDIGLIDLLAERDQGDPTAALQSTFFGRIGARAYRRILDLGGRDRSNRGINYFAEHHEVTVFDIQAHSGVQVVGDAHELSRHFPAGHFDALHCRSVLEHLLMPWKVVVEAAKVLRLGGLAYFHTHQTIGMHDMPWDFWRFSDTAWDALFNEYTGFRIVGRALGLECFVIPHRWRSDAEDAERAAGFEHSTVLVEKIAEPRLDWPVPLSRIVRTTYPSA